MLNGPGTAGGCMSEARVHFLGSGDAFGSGGRFQSCLFVEHADGAFLLDCGASSLIAIKRAGIDPERIDAILLTHLHGDHFGGIPFFVLDAQFSRRTRPLVVAGPAGLEGRIHAAMEVFFPGSSLVQQRFALEFVELMPGAVTRLGALDVAAYDVVHASGAPAHALRISCGESGSKVLACSGDTEWTDALAQAADGADLFVCEGYSFSKQIKFHLDYHSLLRHRAELTCRRLMLTHPGPDMLDHAAALDCQLAEDGLIVDL